jgi:manganese/zinc/iron transport system permease protein
MSPVETFPWQWNMDGWIVLTGSLCAIAASLPGNFLLLRRMSMLGDAISHAILPGLAAAFLISDSRSSWAMFIGAVIVGILTALFTEWIRGFGEVDEGASMGVVFTTMFAAGLVMIVQVADHVDLDPACVLYGSIENTWWDTLPAGGLNIPRVVLVLGTVTLINLLFVLLCYKELQISAFDPALATATGIRAGLMHYLLMIVVAVTAVASFESVGSILVVAMFVVPPAAARLLTDRLSRMILLSAVIAACSAVLGHVSAISVPAWFGYRSANTAGMMALAAGVLFLLCALFGPRQGILVRGVRSGLLSLRILSEDLIALMYRIEERGTQPHPTLTDLHQTLLASRWSTWLLMKGHKWRGCVTVQDRRFHLTENGRRRGTELVRSHRLWENYLAVEAGMPMDRIHDQAEKLEHFTGRDLRDRLDLETFTPAIDPHGSRIPAEGDAETNH